MMELWPGRLTRLSIGLLIGGVTLWWAARQVNYSLVWQTLAGVSPLWVGLSLAGVVGVALAKTARWAALYGEDKQEATFSALFSTLMTAQLANVMIPVRIGELIRLGWMKQLGIPGSATLSTLILEKTIDLLAAGLVAMVLVVIGAAPPWLQEPAIILLRTGLVLSVTLTLLWRSRQLIVRRLTLANLHPIRWHGRFLSAIQLTLDALKPITGFPSLFRLLGWTVIIWLLSLMTVITLFAAFNLDLPIVAAVIIVLALSFSNVAPSPPALIGVMHGIAVAVLGYFNIAPSVAFGFGVGLNVVTVAPLILLGSAALGLRVVSHVRVRRNQPGNQWITE